MYCIDVVFPIAIDTYFSYLNSTDIQLSSRVIVPFGKKEKVGMVVKCRKVKKNETFKIPLKIVVLVLDNKPLISKELIQLINWMISYYHYWPGIIWKTCLANHLWKVPNKSTRKTKETPTKLLEESVKKVILNKSQEQAINQINQMSNQFCSWLLHGVTGSGKTEVYLAIAEHVIKQEKQVLILVPEISLTQQNALRFAQRFGEIHLYHSDTTLKHREKAFNAAKSNECKIMVGTRSAIFSPLENLGLIIIDEEHDDSYRQFDGVHYSARDVAVMRAKIENIPIVLGSATPSLETLYNVEKHKYNYLSLPKRAGNANFPKIRFVDMRKRKKALSDVLIKEIQNRLDKNEQSLLFLNRRGYSPILICRSCGWVPECDDCQRPPTFHKMKNLLHCHICDSRKTAPIICPSCQSNNINTIGHGTEQIEMQLQQLFPNSNLARLDRDSTKAKGSLQKILAQTHAGEIDILLGTQMISKGHDLPSVTLVGIINTDQGLLSPHYRTEEKLIQLITQVSGRSGRGEIRGEVIIQTYHPEHPTLQNLFQFGYMYSANQLLNQRKQTLLPPYQHQALLRVEGINYQKAEDFINKIYTLLHQKNTSHIIIYPIVSSSIEKIGKFHRLQCLMQSSERNKMHQLLEVTFSLVRQWNRSYDLRWSLQLDPTDL